MNPSATPPTVPTAPGTPGTTPPPAPPTPAPNPLSGAAGATVPPAHGNPASPNNPLNTATGAAVPPAAPTPASAPGPAAGVVVNAATPVAPPSPTVAPSGTTPAAPPRWGFFKKGPLAVAVIALAGMGAGTYWVYNQDKSKEGDPAPQRPTPGQNPSSEPPADIKKFSEPLLGFFKSEVEALRGCRPIAPKPFEPFEDPERWFGQAAEVNERVISAILNKNNELQHRAKGNPALLTDVEIQSIGLPPLDAAHQLAYGYRSPGMKSLERLTKQVAPLKGQPATSAEVFLKHPNHIDDWPSDWPNKVVDSIVLRLGQLQRLETALSEVAKKPK